MRVIDMAGRTFGSLTVISRSDKTDPAKRAFWNCRCVCGTEKTICGQEMRCGKTISCGCSARGKFLGNIQRAQEARAAAHSKRIPGVILMLRDGKSPMRVAESIHISPTTVRKIRKEAGISEYVAPKRRSDTPWTDEKESIVRKLWAEGKTTNEIGRLLDLSKNAIVGKVHNLKLPGRPSPIRRSLAPFPSAPRPVFALPPLHKPAQQKPLPTCIVPLRRDVQPVARGECCWPIGEPRTRGFRYCDGLSLPNKPYCVEHAKLAYVRIRDRKHDAA